MKGETKYISQVTIVCPKVKDGDVEQPLYYQKELWLNLFAKSNVKLVYLDYVGDNQYASYDQWIQGYLAYPDFEYFIFIEDDYCIHPSLTTFDSILVDYYNASVKEFDDMGYVCTLAARMNRMNHHSAISNGMVNKKTMVALGEDVLDEFYRFSAAHYCQSAFSLMFQYKNVHVLSMHRDFVAWFWSTGSTILQVYSNKRRVTNLFFVPIQFLLQHHFEVEYIPVNGDEVDDVDPVVEKVEVEVGKVEVEKVEVEKVELVEKVVEPVVEKVPRPVSRYVSKRYEPGFARFPQV